MPYQFTSVMKTASRLVLLALTSNFASNYICAEWHQYRGPGFDGVTTETLNVDNLKREVLWKVPTPNGFSSFSAAGGLVATLATRQDEDGITRETCFVYNASSGKMIWSADLAPSNYKSGGGNAGAKGNDGGDGPRSTPTLHGGKVYVYDADMNLYSFETKSGKLVWKQRIGKDFDGQEIRWKNAVSPLIEGDLVIVPGGGAGNAFLAFNKNTGAVAWKNGDATMTHATPTIATLHGVRKAIFFMTSGLVGVDIKNGKILWEQTHPYKVSTAASPVVDGDFVYCSAGYGVGGGLYKVSKRGGKFSSKRVWFSKDVVNHWSTPVLYKGHLYGMFSFKKYGNGPIQCIELATGKEKWRTQGFGPGNVTLTGDGKILALSDDGHLVVIQASPSAYKELGRVKAVSGKCWSTPILSGGRIYARSTKEGVCIDVSGG